MVCVCQDFGESEAVAVAIHEHYAPRFGDAPPAHCRSACCIADKMDTLAACLSWFNSHRLAGSLCAAAWRHDKMPPFGT